MRVWPSSFAGLRLTLSPGWYPLPAHITGLERRRLLELIALGVEDIAYVAELEWDTLDKLGPRLELHRTLVLVRVPDGVAAGEDVVRTLGAKLGSVRVGLVQRETAGDWLELAWQERQIKVPLLNWLREQLHAATHPLTRLDVRVLPVDELAQFTPEPVELLVMLEDVVAHRMRHIEGGVAVTDWRRSMDQAVVERFASRFRAVDEARAADALEFVIVHGDQSVVNVAERLVGARALAAAGLASIRGSDMLIGPLARFAGRRDKLPRLLTLLPASAWSDVSRRELGRAMPPLFVLPRAVLMVPEPPYSRWPAFFPPAPEPVARFPGLAPVSVPPVQKAERWFHHLIERGEPYLGRRLTGVTPKWIDSILTLLLEIGDLDRLAADVERGRFHRFDAIDSEWSDVDNGAEIRAYLRWLALTLLLRHAHDAATYGLILFEIAHALSLGPSPLLRGSLHALRGDVHASMADYSTALDAWEQAGGCWQQAATTNTPGFELGIHRANMRRTLGHLRLDQLETARDIGSSVERGLQTEFFMAGEVDTVVEDVCHELLTLMSSWSVRLGAEVPHELDWRTRDQIGPHRPAPALTITRAAIALELGDWPRALELTRAVDATLDTPEGARALLLDATIRGTLGDLDAAGSTITAVREHARVRGDQLLLALSHRALASFPSDPSRQAEYRDAVKSASELERKLGLPDALLLEVERTGWALMAGNATGEQYEAALNRLGAAASGVPSLAGASMQAQLRMIALFISSARAKGELPAATFVDGLVALVSGGVKARDISPWFDIACEELIKLVQARIDAGAHADARTLIASTRRLVSDDASYLAQLDRLEHLARPPENGTS